MVYILAMLALAAPIALGVQTIRGRVKPQCCSVVPERDVRMSEAFADD